MAELREVKLVWPFGIIHFYILRLLISIGVHLFNHIAEKTY